MIADIIIIDNLQHPLRQDDAASSCKINTCAQLMLSLNKMSIFVRRQCH